MWHVWISILGKTKMDEYAIHWTGHGILHRSTVAIKRQEFVSKVQRVFAVGVRKVGHSMSCEDVWQKRRRCSCHILHSPMYGEFRNTWSCSSAIPRTYCRYMVHLSKRSSSRHLQQTGLRMPGFVARVSRPFVLWTGDVEKWSVSLHRLADDRWKD